MSLDKSFNPFALHPFTSGGSSPTPNAPPKPITSTPTYPQHHNTSSFPSTSSMYTPGPARRSDPSTPPDGHVPSRPSMSSSQQIQQAPPSLTAPIISTPQPRKQYKDSGIFTQYKADGRRTPDLGDIISKNASIGGRWPVGGKGQSR